MFPAALGLIALTALTACSASTETPKASQGASASRVESVEALPAATKSVDTVTWALSDGEPASLDPLGGDNWVIPNLCDNLLRLNADFSVSEGLATSAEWTDNLTFVIHLRDGVTFWDGTPVTAEDAAYSMSRNLDITSPWSGSYALVNSIEATSTNEVTVTFSAHDSTFRSAIADYPGLVMSKAYAESAGADLGSATGGIMCSGPFSLESWTPGQGITIVANDNYWDGAPLTGKINFVFIPDSTTLTNALLAGEVDGAFYVPLASRKAFEASTTGTLYSAPSTRYISLGLLTQDGPVASVQIRQALSMAIDRQVFVDAVLNGLGTVQKTFSVPFAWKGNDSAAVYDAAYAALDGPVYDVEAAKKLVEAAGVDTNTPIVIASVAGNTEFSKSAAIIQSAAASIGLTVQIEELQFADYYALFYDPSTRDPYDMFIAVGYQTGPNVVGYAQQFVLTEDQGGYYNTTGYDNPEVTDLMLGARNASTSEEAATLFTQAQAIYAPDTLQIMLAGMDETLFLSNDLTGPVVSIASVSSPWALHLGGK
jgi:peptide/nickel transport system substrate-binding protein